MTFPQIAVAVAKLCNIVIFDHQPGCVADAYNIFNICKLADNETGHPQVAQVNNR